MPYKLSENKLSVLDENGKVVPSGTYRKPADALARLQAMNIAYRREEGKPVAPDNEKFNPNHDPGGRFAPKNVLPIGGVGPAMPSKKPAKPPHPEVQKASWLDDPTDDELYQWLINEGMGDWFKNFNPGNGIDRASYHPVDERFSFVSAPDWNNDAAVTLPEVWVRAHPYGDSKNQDAHEEHFDKRTNFYEKEMGKDLANLPVTYYHNYNPDGTPSDVPTVIGKTIGRKYLNDGRWDKVKFFENVPSEIKSRLSKSLADKTFRSSPTVIPDLHKVDARTGHIDNWATGSIAVFDADGERQPANSRAIGIPAMKALFKQAQIAFPKHLEVKMGKVMKAAPSWKARVLKAVIKALGEEGEENGLHSHPDGSQHENHDGYEQAHEHGENGEMKALETSGQNLVDDTSSRARFEGADLENVSKDVQPLPDIREVLEEEAEATERGNPLKDQDVRLDWKPEQKMMKARIAQLESERDSATYDSWFAAQLQAGKVLPAERAELRVGYLQAQMDDRTIHTMKSKVSRLALFTGTVERREPRFGARQLDPKEMKALGYQAAGFDQTGQERAFDEARRQELLQASPLGQQIAKK
jgi:hypothetical protein